MVVVDAILKTRAKLMMEFKASKSSEWKPDEEIGLWHELEAEVAKGDRVEHEHKDHLLEFIEDPVGIQIELTDGDEVRRKGEEVDLPIRDESTHYDDLEHVTP